MMWGCGMPTLDGMRHALSRVGASPGGEQCAIWTCLREESVLYIKGRPFVCRSMQDALCNTKDREVDWRQAEGNEDDLKKELLSDPTIGSALSKKLYYERPDEGQEEEGVYGKWVKLGKEDVLTPREAYDRLCSEGYHVEYVRLCITDEEAPPADVLFQLQWSTSSCASFAASLRFCIRSIRSMLSSASFLASENRG